MRMLSRPVQSYLTRVCTGNFGGTPPSAMDRVPNASGGAVDILRFGHITRIEFMRSTFGSYPRRVRIGLVLILLFAATSSMHWLRNVVSATVKSTGVDEITTYEARYQELRHTLPPNIVVGYLSDPVPPDLSRSEGTTRFKRFVLTQYALSPVIVVRSTETDFVVGNFESPAHADSAAAYHLTLVRDFGAGVMLFRKKKQ